MSDQPLLLRDYSRLSVSLAPTAVEARDAALVLSALIGRVTDVRSQETAVAAQREIRGLIKEIEKTRKVVKAPVLDYAHQIDQTARDFVTPLEEEDVRLGDLVSEFQEAQMAIAREVEQRRQEELTRLQAEQQAALRATQKAIMAEAATAGSEAEREVLVSRATAKIQRQEDLHRQALEAVGGPVVPVKAEGQMVRVVPKFEVTDLWQLARCHPGLVRIEPNRAEINEVLSRGVRSIAGLRIWEETVSSVRVGRTPEVLELSAQGTSSMTAGTPEARR